VEELMQVAIPDFVGDVTISQDIIDYCDARAVQPSGGDRFAILQPPVGSNAQEAVDWFRYDLLRYSRFAAMYWPHIKVADPLSDNRPLTMPCLGHIAGIYARTDAAKNVGKAPGGTVDGALRFLTGLELDPSQGERDLVYQNKINPLINSPQTGLAVWGVRTISSESEWRYINVRRLFMFLEKSVYNATHWIVFENNGPALWARIKAQLNGFLLSLFNDGYFAGTAPSEAFFVIVDDSNNDANTIAAGQVIIDIGVAANTPAEFVRFRFQQVTLAA
jgi:phage tail sheath protein FI